MPSSRSVLLLAMMALLGAACAAHRGGRDGPETELRPWQRPGVVPDQAASPPAPLSARSTLSGVYTDAQAERGNAVYTEWCQSCHGTNADVELDIGRVWGGQRLSDLFAYSLASTPRNSPGALRPQQYADVIAYVFWLRGMPSGTVELPPSDSLLRDIRIELPAKTP